MSAAMHTHGFSFIDSGMERVYRLGDKLTTGSNPMPQIALTKQSAPEVHDKPAHELALSPSVNGSGFLEFMPGADVTTPDACQALNTALKTQGMRLLKQPFPGEPEGMLPEVRSDLWSMWFASNLTVRKCVKDYRKKLIKPRRILEFSTWVIITTFTICNYISNPINAFDGLSLIFLTVLYMLFGHIMFKIFPLSTHVLNHLLNDYIGMWPNRILGTLIYAEYEGVLISHELQALQKVIREVGLDKNWSVVPLEDQIGMSELSYILAGKKKGFHKGVQLGISGKNSELISRACSMVMPDRLEELINRAKNPLSINI